MIGSSPTGPVWVLQSGGWSPLCWRQDQPTYTLDTARPPIVAYTPPGTSELTVRHLTPRECERLQGFPDDWTAATANGTPLSDGVRYRMLGNAVAVPVAEWIGRRLLAVHADPREDDPP